MLITEMKGRRNVQGNELCFKSEQGLFFFFIQGHGAEIEAKPRAGLREVSLN